MRDPLSIANVDSLLDTVTALVADCDHESIKRLKNIEAYTSRCKLISVDLIINNVDKIKFPCSDSKYTLNC